MLNNPYGIPDELWMDEPIQATWVIGTYTGKKAKSVLAHAENNIGYIILENSNGSITAAFRFILDRPIPPHLIEVTDPMQIQKYEKLRKQRES